MLACCDPAHQARLQLGRHIGPRLGGHSDLGQQFGHGCQHLPQHGICRARARGSCVSRDAGLPGGPGRACWGSC